MRSDGDLLLSKQKVRRASIAKILPVAADLRQQRHAILAISLNNSNYVSDKLAAMIAMASSRFDECTLLVGDSIYRLTLCLSEGISEDEAWERSLRMGAHYVRENAPLLPSSGNVSFLLCSELSGKPGVRSAYEVLLGIYQENTVFRNSVQGFARSYGERVDIAPQAGFCHAQQYLLEELALFSHLVGMGSRLILYAGNIQTVADIAAGACGDMRDLFAGLVFGSIRLKSTCLLSGQA